MLWHKALVHRDCHVAFEYRLYSVPWRFIGQHVWLRATPTEVTLYADDVRVATHDHRRHPDRHTEAVNDIGKSWAGFQLERGNIFEQFENDAWANNRHRCDLLGYATAVLK